MKSSRGTFNRACLIRSDLSRPCLISEATFSRRFRAKSSLLLLVFLGGGICQPYMVLPRSQRDSPVILKIARIKAGMSPGWREVTRLPSTTTSVRAEDYDLLLLPGGEAQATLRRIPEAVAAPYPR